MLQWACEYKVSIAITSILGTMQFSGTPLSVAQHCTAMRLCDPPKSCKSGVLTAF